MQVDIPSQKLVWGFGINDVSNVTHYIPNTKKRTNCPYYQRWHGMLSRCYSDQYKKRYPTYLDVTCSESWRFFSDFKSWMEKQKWYGYELDKDILVEGNKIYSPDTCIFVPQHINKLFNLKLSSTDNTFKGVSINPKGNNKFRARIRYKGKTLGLGSFATLEEAQEAWLSFCRNKIREAGDEYYWIHPNFRDRMYEKASLIKL